MSSHTLWRERDIPPGFKVSKHTPEETVRDWEASDFVDRFMCLAPIAGKAAVERWGGTLRAAIYDDIRQRLAVGAGLPDLATYVAELKLSAYAIRSMMFQGTEGAEAD